MAVQHPTFRLCVSVHKFTHEGKRVWRIEGSRYVQQGTARCGGSRCWITVAGSRVLGHFNGAEVTSPNAGAPYTLHELLELMLRSGYRGPRLDDALQCPKLPVAEMGRLLASDT